jgi:metal-dependent amidase/aminoacylase/carboxypeptidase family protein
MRVERIATNVAEAHGLITEVEWFQPVPALHNDRAWLKRILSTVERVLGKGNIQQRPSVLGYDDASEFINPIGRAYIFQMSILETEHQCSSSRL